MKNYQVKIMETDLSQMLFEETTPRLKIYKCIYLLKDYFIDGRNTFFEKGEKAPKLHPEGAFFGP